MANSISLYTVCFSLLLLTTTNGVLAYLVDDVCAKTQNPRLCLQALGGSAVRTKPLTVAAELGFQMVGPDILGFKNLFHILSNTSRVTPKVRALSAKCETLFDHPFTELIVPAHEAARVGRWADVKPYAAQILADIDACENLFTGNSPVHEDSRKVRVAAEALGIIAQILSH